MSTEVLRRRGTLGEHSTFVGAEAEITVIEGEWSLRVHDGETAGGHPINGVRTLSAEVAPGNWYRIAQSEQGIGGNHAQFVVEWDAGNDDIGQSVFNATCNLGNTATSDNVRVNEISYSTRTNGTGVTYARVNYHPTYTGNYAYLEVFVAGSNTTNLTFTITDPVGWQVVAPTSGSVPGGYIPRTFWLGYERVPKRRTISTHTTTGWYRIASTPINVGRNHAIFQLDWTAQANHHGQAMFVAAVNFAYDSAVELKELSFSGLGRTTGITKARVVYESNTYTDRYAYLEVFLASDVETILFSTVINPLGWLIQQPDAGSIPEGYTSRELTFAGAEPFDVAAYLQGQIEGESPVMRYVFTRAVTFPRHFAGSYGRAAVATTNEKIFSIRRNGSEIATMTFAAAGETASFSSSTEDSQHFYNAGDTLSVYSPEQDATMADVYFTLMGWRGLQYMIAPIEGVSLDGPTSTIAMDPTSVTTSNRLSSITVEDPQTNYYAWINVTPFTEYSGLFLDTSSPTASHGFNIDPSSTSAIRFVMVSAANAYPAGNADTPLAASDTDIEALFDATPLAVVNFFDDPYGMSGGPTAVPPSETRTFGVEVCIGEVYGTADATLSFQVTITQDA